MTRRLAFFIPTTLPRAAPGMVDVAELSVIEHRRQEEAQVRLRSDWERRVTR